jgi:hypothetical protein
MVVSMSRTIKAELMTKPELIAEVNRLRAEREELIDSVLNQSGDNLCWLTPAEIKIPPRDQFLESCARYHAQISGERGELTGCKTIAQLETEVYRLHQWVSDLQSGMFINCVYCGHRYGPDPGTPIAMAEVLKLHIEQCLEHPMSKLKAESELLKGLLKANGIEITNVAIREG